MRYDFKTTAAKVLIPVTLATGFSGCAASRMGGGSGYVDPYNTGGKATCVKPKGKKNRSGSRVRAPRERRDRTPSRNPFIMMDDAQHNPALDTTTFKPGNYPSLDPVLVAE